MVERTGPQVYSIAAHRGFADALVAGLVPRYGEDDLGLARLTLLLPSQRAARTVTEAFIRHDEGASARKGLLLPRMAVVGDLDLDEVLGPLLDPLGLGVDISPAVDPSFRWLRLAELLREVRAERKPSGPALLREAAQIGRAMDRLLVEGVAPEDLLNEAVLGVVPELADHWKASLHTFATVRQKWLFELEEYGQVDAPARRNALFDHAAATWRANPPEYPIVAAGVTSASPALARLLRTVSELPRGAVILPDLDLELDDEVWDDLGLAGIPAEVGGAPFGSHDAVTHPQYHLKLLLNRMGVARGEVQAWHRSGPGAAPPRRSRAISNLFLPPRASSRWVHLPGEDRSLANVRLMESAAPGEESQAIALLIRQALEEPEKRVALITPDRELAARVIAQLQRWDIMADDSAGQPLHLTAAGRLFLQLAELVAAEAAPVPLLALLGHPWAGESFGRADWLDQMRRLDLALRGPRPDAGLAPIAALVARLEEKQSGIAQWWQAVEAILGPVMAIEEQCLLADALDALAAAAEALSGGKVWGGADGRSLAGFVEDLREGARKVGTQIERDGIAVALRDAMAQLSVRPPWGGHPRLAIYGLIEARMSRADLVICGGLIEGVWPAAPAPDPLLAPPVLRALGVPGGDFRIGLSAHDLAAALGAPEVVLSHARRDAAGPAIPSRFVLRIRAMLGERLLKSHVDEVTPRLARLLVQPAPVPPHPRPRPCPSAEQRDVPIAVTGLDRLRGDPYQFYASDILRLRALDLLDAAPTAAWKGTLAHDILKRWHAGEGPLAEVAKAQLDTMSSHPLARGLWWPRLLAALQWIAESVADLAAKGRIPVKWEADGHFDFEGVKIKGRADRIDRLSDGTLAIVDYKTGSAPSFPQVKKGYALQLGLIGLMAQRGAFPGLVGEPSAFEYWTFQKSDEGKDKFGKLETPILTGKKRTGFLAEEFIPVTEGFLREAVNLWIKGTEPFKAKPNPDYKGYTDYDQLMRLDEWMARGEDGE